MCQFIIDLRNVTLCRSGNTILKDISWQVGKGENWAIVGANGSGKTTLLKVLAGYEWPTCGTVTVLDEEHGKCDIRNLRNRIGWVSNTFKTRIPTGETALQTVATGRYSSIGTEYVRLNEKDLADAKRYLEQVECPGLAERPFSVLSQGEQQRVLIARAFMTEPDILVLDEACAGLDMVSREHFLAYIERLGQKPQAPALLMVTHHIEEISPTFTHALILADGKIISRGRKEETITSDNMSCAFGEEVTVEFSEERFRARLANSV